MTTTPRKRRSTWKQKPSANTLAARALGVTPHRLASYRKLGCKIEDLDAARRWIADWEQTLANLRVGGMKP